MAARARLDAWLKGTHLYDRDACPFEMAVAQGLAAQETVTAKLRDAFMLGDPEIPEWLKIWAANLTAEEIASIKTGRVIKRMMLRQHVDRLLTDDPAEWSDAERDRAAELSRRLSAVGLVLRARSEAVEDEGEGLDETTFLPDFAAAAT